MATPIDISEKSGIRYLHFGLSIQGAMRIRQPWQLELEYTRELMLGLALRSITPTQVLIIGLGTASVVKFLHRHYPDCNLTVVEIEASVVSCAQQYFKLPTDAPNIQIVIQDGAEYISQTHQNFDLIIVDGYDQYGNPGKLESLTFYQQACAKLNDQGVFTVNLFGKSKFFPNNLSTLQQGFPYTYTFAPCSSGNVIVAASKLAFDITTLKSNITLLQQKTGIDLHNTLHRINT